MSWMFVSKEHAVSNMEHGGRLVACPDCAAACGFDDPRWAEASG